MVTVLLPPQNNNPVRWAGLGGREGGSDPKSPSQLPELKY